MEASRLEPVGNVFISQLSVADQCDRGDTWSKQWSRGSPSSQVGLLLALKVELSRHVLTYKSLLQRSQISEVFVT